MDIINLIVIGAGLIGPRHCEHIYKRPDAKLFAIVDHSAKGPAIAAKFNTLLFQTIDEMIRYVELNNLDFPHGAIIATPNHTHVEMAMKLAGYNIHLLIEKPLASSVHECEQFINFIDTTNVRVLVGHHRRFNPYIMQTKKNLHKIGRPIAVQGTWCLKKDPAYFLEKPWRSDPTKGGGTLLINLVHDLDLLIYLLGPIVKVYAELLSKQRPYDVDEGAILTMTFKNGCKGTFICSDNIVLPFNFESGTGENPNIPFYRETDGFYRIFGSHGTLSVPDLKFYHQNNNGQSWGNEIEVENVGLNHDEDMEVDALTTPATSFSNLMSIGIKTPNYTPSDLLGLTKLKPFDLQLEHFINLINGTESFLKCTATDALNTLLCIDKVLQLVRIDAPVSVDYVV